MVIGGLKGNPSEAIKGKKVLWNAVLGIIIILASWLLIDTIIKSVGGFPISEGFGPWNEIQCIAPAIKFPTHFGCNADKKCVQMEGSQGNECNGTAKDKDRNCTEHFGCDTDKQKCIVITSKGGLDTCNNTEDTTTCAKPIVNAGTCTGTGPGASCSDKDVNTCQPASSADCATTNVNSWQSEINDAITSRFGPRTICSGIDTEKMVKATMAQESGGNINAVSPSGTDFGLMQMQIGTAESVKSLCDIPDSVRITKEWFQNRANAAKSICLAIKYMQGLSGLCGCSIRNISAGYNGAAACNVSKDCGPGAGPGQCTVCSNQVGSTQRWECLWDNPEHTECNVDKKGSSFSGTRAYAPKVWYCYSQF